MSKNYGIDLFAADKAMSDRVASFMRVKVWNITLKARLDDAMKRADQRIETLEGLHRDTGRDYSEAIQDILAVREKAKADYKTAIEEGEKFDFTPDDKALYKAYKDGNAVEGLRSWFATYGLDVPADCGLMKVILDAIAGSRRLGGRAIVRANAERFTDDTRTRSDVLVLFYGKLAEAMMQVGTLKPEAIPADVRAMYAPRKKASK